MKKLIFAGMTLLTLSAMAMTPAEARDGCGPHRFRAWNGHCYWIRPAPPPAPIMFGFYGGFRPHGWGWHRHW